MRGECRPAQFVVYLGVELFTRFFVALFPLPSAPYQAIGWKQSTALLASALSRGEAIKGGLHGADLNPIGLLKSK